MEPRSAGTAYLGGRFGRHHCNPPAPPYSPVASNPLPMPDDLRPNARHYFTRASIWHTRGTRLYAAYDFVRHTIFDSSTRFMIPGYPEVLSSEDSVVINEAYRVPRRGFSSFPPEWVPNGPTLQIFVNFKEDVFYFSSWEFPCVRRHRSLSRVERAALRVTRPLRHRVELVTLQSSDKWIEKIEKIALHAPSLYTSPRSFILHPNDKVSLTHMPRLKKIYLVIPRDPECYHGPHRTWVHAQVNEDGFLLYRDFVQLHDALQVGPTGGKECKCWTDGNPTHGEVENLRRFYEFSDHPPEIIVIIEDILR